MTPPRRALALPLCLLSLPLIVPRLTMADSPHTPLRATWSSLKCLASLDLTPPSPVCSPSSRPKRASSGEIPFILDSGIIAPTSPTNTSIYTTRPVSQLSTFTYREPTCSSIHTTGRIPSEGLVNLSTLGSSISVNTFGLRHSPLLAADTNVSPKPNQYQEMQYFSPSLIPFSTPNLSPSPLLYSPVTSSHNSANRSPPFNSLPSSNDALESRPSVPVPESWPLNSTTLDIGVNRDEDVDQTIKIAFDAEASLSNQAVSTYFTVTDDIPRSESICSGLSFLALDDLVPADAAEMSTPRDAVSSPSLPSASIRASVYSDQSLAFAHMSPTLSSPSLFPRPPRAPPRKVSRNVAIRRPGPYEHRPKPSLDTREALHVGQTAMISAPSQTSHIRSHSNSSVSSMATSAPSSDSYPSRSSNSGPSSTSHSLNLPPHLAWLQHVRIDLMIDQENFREIRPTFRLVGMHAAYGGQALAEFRPVERRAFNFHHSSLDPDPILRRLLVDGDEEHDGFSRLAVLSLKSEGVYAITGVETARAPRSVQVGSFHPLGADVSQKSDVKLTWKFVYLVADRLSSSGIPLPGEKTVTPLSFSCAPRLLHANIGHRVGLLQIARKAARPKLTAQLVGPPKPSAPLAPVSTEQIRVVADTKENIPPSSAWSNLHSRQTSAASSDGGDDDDMRGLLRSSGRRRAASVSSPPPPTRMLGHPFASGFALVDKTTQLDPHHLLDRHILSKAELAKMAAISSPLPPPKWPLPAVPTGQFGGLRPPPVASRSLNSRLGTQ
jgi:hypothetical protein